MYSDGSVKFALFGCLDLVLRLIVFVLRHGVFALSVNVFVLSSDVLLTSLASIALLKLDARTAQFALQ